MTVNKVELDRQVIKDLWTLPKHIIVKLQSWIDLVETSGITEARKVPGYHDEPLQGERKGQRSIRLSRGYRAFYTVKRLGNIECLTVWEVNKHDY